jgi:CRISPR-associated endonuclease/helicase Cas3
MKYLAHAYATKQGMKEQAIEEHVNGVVSLMLEFSKSFCEPEWAKFMAEWHDLGKYLPSWQAYFKEKIEYIDDDSEAAEACRGSHSTLGAAFSISKFGNKIGKLLAYPILGHHAGLPDFSPGEGASISERLFHDGSLRKELLDDLNELERKHLVCFTKPSRKTPFISAKNPEIDSEHLHLLIRMLFSCLVDADFLDTEAFMSPDVSKERGLYPTLNELKGAFEHYMEGKLNEAEDKPLNRRRKEILEQCRKKAVCAPGFFSLTVPTGGGKTLSSMAFALEHAIRYGKTRIILAIPYTSIIEQTAKVFKYGSDDEKRIKNGERLFGEETVIEHHSNLNPEYETQRSHLACENWDAPIIVTTNVRLFESLHASKPGDCRKLHNIINSVIILDEAQMLPPELLQPILSTLRGLVKHFGVSVVLCTATQPAFSGVIGASLTAFEGIKECKEIMDDPEELINAFKRVTIHLPKQSEGTTDWETLTNKILEHEQVLCIVNSRRDCRELHKRMPEGTYHLSASMCGEERSDIIGDIKERLRKGEKTRVISTQLIEAGVDIDFPVVFRALAGIDSLAQAAGRCNREAKYETGHFYVFTPPKLPPQGLLLKGAQTSQALLSEEIDQFNQALYEKYFRSFYASVNDTDRANFKQLLKEGATGLEFQFRSFAKAFCLIDEKNQKSVIVPYAGKRRDGRELIRKLEREGPHRELLRAFQRFIVNIPFHQYKSLFEKGYLYDTNGYMVLLEAAYVPGKGVIGGEENAWNEEGYII